MLTLFIFSDRIRPQFNTTSGSPIRREFHSTFEQLSLCGGILGVAVFYTMLCLWSLLSCFIWPINDHLSFCEPLTTQALTTDPTLFITMPEGTFHCAALWSQSNSLSALLRTSGHHPTSSSRSKATPSMPPGTPISTQSHLKKMRSSALSSVRVPSIGFMRSPAPPTVPAISTHIFHPVTKASAGIHGKFFFPRSLLVLITCSTSFVHSCSC